MNIITILFHFTIVLVAPIFVMGIINRVKSIWSGRRGPRLYQTWFDLVRLLKKKPVYSVVTTWIFPLAPVVVLATSLTASLFVPLVPGYTPLSFTGDFIAFLYILGLGKVFMMLAALDTGSPFEGMGASREATYSALVESVFLLALVAVAIACGSISFSGFVFPAGEMSSLLILKLAFAGAMFVVLLVEGARVPADDPTTHLELTMVHEVMILDNSGPELAMVQYGSAMKTTLIAGIIAAVLNPFSAEHYPWLAMVVTTGFIAIIAAAIGLVESLVARLRFRALPLFIFAALMAAMLSVIVVSVNQGPAQ